MRTAGSGGGGDKLQLQENKEINATLEKFDKRNEKRVASLQNRVDFLKEGDPARASAEEGLRKIESERKELEDRLKAQMKRGTVSVDGAAPKEEARPAGVPADARKAPDGHYYAPDPNRPGKYLKYS
jgi:hypothetical protein